MSRTRPPPDTVGGAPERHDDLLASILATAVDPGYTHHAPSTGASNVQLRAPAIIVMLAAFGILLGVSAMETAQGRPTEAVERAELVDQIHRRQDHLDVMHTSLSSLREEVSSRQAALARSMTAATALRERTQLLAFAAGTAAANGPGVRVTVDNAENAGNDNAGVVRDKDLQLLVNGLWQAGAEGVAINGHRLTNLTSIRFAGQAITVAYRSLSTPYIVEAIGDSDTLPARLLETEAGRVWQGLHVNFGLQFDVQATSEVSLPAATVPALDFAHKGSR